MSGSINRLLLVLCLVLLEWTQARAVEEQPDVNVNSNMPSQLPVSPTDGIPKRESSPLPTIFLNNTIPEISEGLYEGDIVLTREQKLLLQERKAIDPAYYWPRDSNDIVTIAYRFGDDIIDQNKVKEAISDWEEKTCIRFTEVFSAVSYVHLEFVDADYCASYVGRMSSLTSGQTIWLHSTCVSQVGSAVHEIGHALGFYHEQSRSDRDDHVKIIWDNVESGKENNFDKETTYNNEVLYDYWSVMHYGPKYFTSNGQETILAYDPVAQPLMGNRIGLSFADKLLANTIYNCLDQWLTECSITSDPCQNLGYTGPDCNCVCPEGTTGAQCEVLEDAYTDALIKLKTPYSEIITTEGVVSTPGYPTPIQTRTKFVKVLVAPDCYNVKLTFTDFQVYGRFDDDTCAIDCLTIRTSDELSPGTAHCDEEIDPGTVFVSETNTIVLDYYNYDYTTVSWDSEYRGFSATIEHVFDATCTPTTTTTPVPSVDFINTGNIPFVELCPSDCSCSLDSLSTAGLYELKSRFYPLWYCPGESCNFDLWTSEPRYLRVTATDIRIGSTDTLVINNVLGIGNRIKETNAGTSYVIPTSSVNIFFESTTWWFGRGYKLSINLLNSDCHQIVEVDAGASGTLTKLNYAGDTVCEWWIQAPLGMEIQLDISTFDVGQSDCSTDYVAIDTSGDRSYEAASQQLCGTNSPGSFTSSGGQLNVLFNGIQGGDSGFTATYSVV